MSPFRAVEAVYFDLDDTLCAYWNASRAGLRRAFELHGPEGTTPEEMTAHWARVFRRFSPTVKDSDWYKDYLKTGEPTRVEQMRMTLLEAGVEDLDRAKLLSQVYAEERDRNLRLFEDALEVLEWAFERYPLGLITNGPADVQRQEISTLGIERFYRHILIEGEIGEGKPILAVFRRAEQFVGKRPEQMLFVGNSYGHDILPAIGAGWKTVWIRRDSDVPPSSALVGPEPIPDGSPQPDAIVGELRELIGLLSG
jgi:putative hydrolase of the HAD superfamily